MRESFDGSISASVAVEAASAWMLYHLRHRSEARNLDAREARGRDVASDRNNEGEKELAMTVETYNSH